MIVNTLWGSEEQKSKICKYCKKEKTLDKFHNNPTRYQGLGDGKFNMCKVCAHADRSFRRRLTKTAPAKPKVCECCGDEVYDTPGSRLVLDHDHDTKIFRGWICSSCNLGLGKLGDILEGVMKAVRYLS